MGSKGKMKANREKERLNVITYLSLSSPKRWMTMDRPSILDGYHEIRLISISTETKNKTIQDPYGTTNLGRPSGHWQKWAGQSWRNNQWDLHQDSFFWFGLGENCPSWVI